MCSGMSFETSRKSPWVLPQECAYVCNMAVDPDHRRQGYGLLLLEAVEEIARLGGQRDLYLHLRYAHTARHWKHVVFAPRRTYSIYGRKVPECQGISNASKEWG